MARTLTEIYTEAKERRNQYLELTEFQNSSKMSVIDAFTWTVSACIWTFENILDIFQTDLIKDLQNRINGTPAYYSNALLKYQSGDSLVMNEEGTAFSYSNIDETKRVITRVAYSELEEEGFHDKSLIFKIATGETGFYERINDEELLAIRAYFKQIAFAGTRANIVSKDGDILIPRVTIYYDGAITEDEVYSNIEKALNSFITSVSFDGTIYVQKVIDAIQRAEHVVDVYIDTNSNDHQGIFVAQRDDDNNLIPILNDDNEVVSYEHKIDRCFTPNSGFVKQSSCSGDEENLPDWRSAMIFKIEK